jgi:hypothetical protein
MKNPISIIKASGEQSMFSEEKVRSSLRTSGADENQIDLIMDEIYKRLHEGMTTRSIYKIAFKLLKSGMRHQAARYHLKFAIMELGPSGFPFEKYMAELLQAEGYVTKTNQFFQGKCVTHEIDVVGEKDSEQLVVECKYHNQQGISCNVKIPLYIHARFNDILAFRESKNQNAKWLKGLIITNTRFSADALQYAGCSGLDLLGWNHPFKNGLKDRIDRHGIYPLTCLTTLSTAEKQKLLEKEVILCSTLLKRPELLKSMGIKQVRAARILSEAGDLCKPVIKSTNNTHKP